MITGILSGHSIYLNCLALSQDNSYVVSGAFGTIIVHSTKTGIVEYRADNIFVGEIKSLYYFPDGSGLVACGGVYQGYGGEN